MEKSPYWVVKEPIGLKYFRFQEEEYAILSMLDGQISLEEIKEQFERRFPPQKITYRDLHQFIGTLHRSGLVVGSHPPVRLSSNSSTEPLLRRITA